MNKEYLEAFNRILREEIYDTGCKTIKDCCEEDCNIVKQALQRLEKIDNANPSEALEIIRKYENDDYAKTWYPKFIEALKVVENYILKAQEQEKVLGIIKEKGVDIRWITENNPSREEYNAYIWTKGHCLDTLEQEEFELIKREYYYVYKN